MARELDRRDTQTLEIPRAREAALVGEARRLSAELPGTHEINVERVDPVTRNAAVVASVDAPAQEGNYIQRALDHVQSIGGALGFAPEQAAEFVADPHVLKTTSGARAVHLQQLYKGIPIYDAARTVVFSSRGALEQTTGTTVTVDDDQAVVATLSVQDAVRKAAEHVASPQPDEEGAVDQFGEPLEYAHVDLEGFEPKVIATFTDDPALRTVLEAGPFGDEIKADLIWFPISEADLRLAWEVQIALPDYAEMYRTLVDAHTGEVLLCVQQVAHVAAKGNVHRMDGASDRCVVEFPVQVAEHGLPLPSNLPLEFPDTWVEGDSAVGNAVQAHLGDAGPTLQGTAENGTIVFDPAPDSDEQKILNLFYFNCLLHDVFYLLGFRERDGNFQRDNFGRGGVPGDRVDARIFPEPVFGTANMTTKIEGTSPTMKMGLVRSTNRHTALDSSVVFHEFTHGVTNRLVGGPTNDRALEGPQSSGMGEGWSDYIACSLNRSDVVGAWVINRPSGIRSHPYDDQFPLTFEDIGGFDDEHDVGEVWAATLLALNRALGVETGLPLVVDALKLTPANPSFLDARDAILIALAHRHETGTTSEEDQAAERAKVLSVFAHFGMGPNARSNGAFLTGIVADFNPPADVQAVTEGASVTTPSTGT
jgi:extracellular elastinolytic metalloproteinase